MREGVYARVYTPAHMSTCECVCACMCVCVDVNIAIHISIRQCVRTLVM